MKYLKYFEQASAYEAYKNGSDFITPNVSYAVDVNSIYYNPGSSASSDYVMVDLGLPSGLLWADKNIGAVGPEDAGLYFAWGETVGYTAEQIGTDKYFNLNWSDYFDTTDGGSTFNKYYKSGLTALEASDDAAAVNMGSEYRMPSKADFEELVSTCNVTFIDLSGNEFSMSDAQSDGITKDNLKGIRFTGTNGNSIFLPAAGYCYNSNLNAVSSNGYLWSSSLNSDDAKSVSAYILCFRLDPYLNISTGRRFFGQPVRGVKSNK